MMYFLSSISPLGLPPLHYDTFGPRLLPPASWQPGPRPCAHLSNPVRECSKQVSQLTCSDRVASPVPQPAFRRHTTVLETIMGQIFAKGKGLRTEPMVWREDGSDLSWVVYVVTESPCFLLRLTPLTSRRSDH